jgi:hypothetical protein
MRRRNTAGVDLPEKFERGLDRIGHVERVEHHVGAYIAFGLAAICAIAAVFAAVTGVIDGDLDPQGVVGAALGAVAFAAIGGFSRFKASQIGTRGSEEAPRPHDDEPDLG